MINIHRIGILSSLNYDHLSCFGGQSVDFVIQFANPGSRFINELLVGGRGDRDKRINFGRKGRYLGIELRKIRHKNYFLIPDTEEDPRRDGESRLGSKEERGVDFSLAV